jgi:hypothetical protein
MGCVPVVQFVIETEPFAEAEKGAPALYDQEIEANIPEPPLILAE